MTEYVFRPSRRVSGKRVRSRLYSGRYSLVRGQKARTVPLHTPDLAVARKRLRDIVVEGQREQEGIIAPKIIRQAAGESLLGLLAEYERDLLGRGITKKYVKGTTNRIRFIVEGCGWQRLADVTPASFVSWRAGLKVAARTVRHYQTSLLACLNWLVRTERLSANPLLRVDRIQTRGKDVRPIRSFSDEELRGLFSVAGPRLPAYLVLLYTGLRKKEVKSLVWEDLHLDDDRPYLLAREATTKDREKRAIPLHPELVPVLKAFRGENYERTARAFRGTFPKRGSLLRDFKRAGIERVDALGRVVHFHSFRKTFQTLGVRFGINQRSAQELLGHSDPRLTANVYTDVPALALHSEVAKLPWVLNDAQTNAQKPLQMPISDRFRRLLSELVEMANSVGGKAVTSLSVGMKLVEVAGVEPACP
jgi:integrase